MDCYKNDIEFKICEEPEESFKYLLRDYKYIKSIDRIIVDIFIRLGTHLFQRNEVEIGAFFEDLI